MKKLDIGHRNYPLDTALSILETEVSQAIFEGKIRVIKVVHGHGRGRLRQAVRDWCNEQTGRFLAVVHGENYDAFDKTSAAMRAACGYPPDTDLGRKNRAVTYIWVR
ncbi:MAG: Smr/MutS family protein [Fidelibacterota bacterium]